MGETALRKRRRIVRRRRFVWLLSLAIGAVVAALFAFALLSLDTAPAVPVQPRPTTEDVAAARKLYHSLDSSDGTTVPVVLDGRSLRGLAALAGDAFGSRRIRMEIENASVVARTSVSLPFSLWLNGSVRLEGEHNGFPELSCAAGRIEFPSPLCGWAIARARDVANWRGANLPPLDRLVRHVAARDGRLRLRVDLPTQGAMIEQLTRLRSAPIDAALAEAIYCRLARGQQASAVPSLSGLLRRAFLPGAMRWTESNNRAALVALAVLVAGEPADALLPGTAAMLQRCPRPQVSVTLRSRADLARHWAFSAGLTAAFGANTAQGMGEWKELDDSRAEGSGFSFLDLAADRSGIDYARRALAADSAQDTAAEFSLIGEDALLPEAVMAAPERLRNVDFNAEYGGIDAARYKQAVAWIDRKLAEGR